MPPLESLQICLSDFQKTGKLLHGKIPNLTAIESLANKHLTKKLILRPEDLERFFKESEPHWWIAKYWHLPKTMNPILLEHSFREVNENNEGQFIELLLQHIKQIELVSIILRFVRPDQYGILSPPVERVLNVRWESNATETYRHYLKDLRKIQKKYNAFLKKVSDADMALWVLHAKLFQDTDNNPEIRKYYETDPFLIQIRTENLMDPLKGMKLSALAEGLSNVSQRLSAVVACHLLEVVVRDFAKLKGVACDGGIKLVNVLNSLKVKNVLSTTLINKLHLGREIRNDFFHQDKEPTPFQFRELIKTIKEIETRLTRN